MHKKNNGSKRQIQEGCTQPYQKRLIDSQILFSSDLSGVTSAWLSGVKLSCWRGQCVPGMVSEEKLVLGKGSDKEKFTTDPNYNQMRLSVYGPSSSGPTTLCGLTLSC